MVEANTCGTSVLSMNKRITLSYVLSPSYFFGYKGWLVGKDSKSHLKPREVSNLPKKPLKTYKDPILLCRMGHTSNKPILFFAR